MDENPYRAPPFDRVTDRVRAVLQTATGIAAQAGRVEINKADLLRALSLGGGIAQVVLEETEWSVGDKAHGSGSLSAIIAIAQEEADVLGHRYPGTEHVLLALVRAHPEAFPDSKHVRQMVLDILGVGN